MPRPRRIAFMLAFLTALVPMVAGAQTSQDAQTVAGTFVSLGKESLVVKTDEGAQRTFVVDSATTKPRQPLMRGQRVTVRYRSDGSRLLALAVTPLGPSNPVPPPGVAQEQVP